MRMAWLLLFHVFHLALVQSQTAFPFNLSSRRCGANQVFNECDTACPRVCGQPRAQFCTEQCIARCVCAPGFILAEPRTSSDLHRIVCIPESSCSSSSTPCPPNEVFRECGTACPGFCGEEAGPRICTLQCVQECQCREGFARQRDPRLRIAGPNPCVPRDSCPAQGPPNPGDVCSQPRVTGPCRAAMRRWFFDEEAGACRSFTYGGCGGNANNFRSEAECRGRCGGDGESGRSCGANAELSECASLCEPRCGAAEDIACAAVCVRGCRCRRGFIFDTAGRDCIPTSECEAKSDPRNPCAANPCPPGQRCLHRPIFCVTTPCPQHRCLPACPATAPQPCQGRTCPAVPDARCESDESCTNAVFIKDGQDVTDRCFRRG